jgi:hypothetical protein
MKLVNFSTSKNLSKVECFQRPLGRSRRRLVDNIKIDLREIGWVVLTGLIWLMTGTGGELLCTR